MAALDRALPLAQVDDVAVLVGDDLDLDVARVADVLLEVDGRVAEGGPGGVGGALDGGDQVLLPLDHLHADAASAAGGLDDHGQPDLERRLAGGAVVGDRLGAGRGGNAVLFGQRPRAELVAEPDHRLRGRSDERDPGRLARLGEGGPLAEEAVAGMDRLGARVHGGLHDPLEVQVGLGRRGAADVDGLAGVTGVDGVAVGVGVDGDGGDVQLVAGAHDANRDLASIGDQDLGEELPTLRAHRVR